jgi:endonuclease/exonuclease/phosphatase family metal-dependent hydrolase
MDTFARLVEAENADVILLQEVARTPELHVDEWLAERLDMAYVYSRANGHKTIGFEEGLAVFSRFPLGNAYLKQLGDKTNPFVHRLALGALLETPCGNMLTFSTHLGIGRRRNGNQMAHLRNWISELGNEFPVLIGGDFNAHETETQIQTTQSTWIDTFRHKNPTADGTTHELHWPWGGVFRRHRLDYIFLQPGSINWIVLESRHLQVKDGPHSDHRAVLTRLKPVPA